MSLRRGFKAEAERISLEVRSELALSVNDPLDVLALAKHLEIPVIGMLALGSGHVRQDFVHFFSVKDQESFSALTLFSGTARIIVHNDSHAPTRQASNIAHEIAHCVLEHPPAPVTDNLGCRYWNKELEDEATWLGAALLVPREGALRWARLGKSVAEIAEQFGVSEQLCVWRLRQTGVIQQLERLKRWRA